VTQPTIPLASRNDIAGTATRTTSALGVGEVLEWGLGAIADNNGWGIPPGVIRAIGFGATVLVQVGWRWLISRAG
jgi:hypothetical protein